MAVAAHNIAEQASDSASQGRPAPQDREQDDLLLLATDRYCVQGSYNRLTQDQYSEAFCLLYDQASVGSKQIIARLLAFQHFAPRSLVYRLALEPLGISRSILKESPVLGQLDLLQLLETRGLEIAPIIASRVGLGPTLVRRLRDFRDHHVDEALANNKSLANTESLSAEALFTTLNTDDHDSESVSIPLETTDHGQLVATDAQQTMEHEEQIDTDADAVVETVPARSKIVSETQDSSPVLSQSQKALLSAAARGARLEPNNPALDTNASASAEAPKGVDTLPLEQTADTVALPQMDASELATALQRAASRGNRQAIVDVLQYRFGLSLETCHQIFEDKEGETFSVLLKSAGVASAAANRVLLLIFPTIGLSVHNASRSIRYYSQLEEDACRDAVDQWPKAIAHSEPQAAKSAQHAPYLADTDTDTRTGQATSTRIIDHQKTLIRKVG